MIIYRDIISNDEMFSDAFKVVDKGFLLEVEGKTVTRKSDDIDDSLIGGNASAEEMAEGTDAGCVSGVDIVLNHKLQETAYDKKQYMAYMKGYVKAIKAKLEESSPDKVDEFVKAAPTEIKSIVTNIKDYQFFTGESMNPDGMVGLLNYREDNITPFMVFIKAGLLVEKC